MSTAYDLRCIDCGVYMGWMDNTDRKLNLVQALLPKVKQLAVLGDLLEEIGPLGFDSIEVKTDHGRLEFHFDFFKVHADHRIRVYDEYGRDVTDCGKQVRCEDVHCGVWGSCRLPSGHEGECSMKAVDDRK